MTASCGDAQIGLQSSIAVQLCEPEYVGADAGAALGHPLVDETVAGTDGGRDLVASNYFQVCCCYSRFTGCAHQGG